MKSKILLLMLGMFLFLSACGTQPYLKENAAFIMFKTPTFKYADMGFVYENAQEVKAEIYGSGQALLSWKISGSTVCMSLLACMSKKSFNAQVLNASYPDDVLENIFRMKPIFSGENFQKNRNGFTQKLRKNGKYNIEYRVLNNDVIFHDRINNIHIEVKKQ